MCLLLWGSFICQRPPPVACQQCRTNSCACPCSLLPAHCPARILASVVPPAEAEFRAYHLLSLMGQHGKFKGDQQAFMSMLQVRGGRGGAAGSSADVRGDRQAFPLVLHMPEVQGSWALGRATNGALRPARSCPLHLP